MGQGAARAAFRQGSADSRRKPMRIRHWRNGLLAAGALSWAACGGSVEPRGEGERVGARHPAEPMATRGTVARSAVERVAVGTDALLPPASLRDPILYY